MHRREFMAALLSSTACMITNGSQVLMPKHDDNGWYRIRTSHIDGTMHAVGYMNPAKGKIRLEIPRLNA